MNRLISDAKSSRDGYRIVKGRVPPDPVEPSHARDFGVTVMVRGGGVTVTLDGKAETASAGDSRTFPAGTLHAEPVGAEGVAYLIGQRITAS
jgi:quercetin dioxygenase-like cupin family protein